MSPADPISAAALAAASVRTYRNRLCGKRFAKAEYGNDDRPWRKIVHPLQNDGANTGKAGSGISRKG